MLHGFLDQRCPKSGPSQPCRSTQTELDADGRFGILVELILGEAIQEIRFSDAGIADKHQLEQVIVVGSECCHPVFFIPRGHVHVMFFSLYSFVLLEE